MDDTQNAIAALEVQLEVSQRKVGEAESKGTLDAKKVVQLEKQLLDIMESTKKETQSERANKEKLETKLAETLEQLRKLEETLAVERDVHKSMLTSLGTQKDEQDARIEELEEEVEVLQEYKSRSAEQISLLQQTGEDNIEKREVEIAKEKSRVAELEKQIEEIRYKQGDSESLASSVTTMTQRIEELSSKNNILENDLTLASGNNGELEGKIKDLEEEIKNLEIHLVDSAVRIEALSTELQEKSEDNTLMLRRTRDEESRVESLQREFTMENAQLQQQLEQLKHEHQGTLYSSTELETAREETRDREAKLKDLEAQLTRETTKLEEALSTALAESTTMRNLATHWEREAKDKEAAINLLHKELDVIKEKNIKQDGRIQELTTKTKQIEEVNAKITHLESLLESERRKRNEGDIKYNELEAKLHSKEQVLAPFLSFF